MSRKITSEEIEVLREEGFGSATDTRGRLLSVLKLLLKFSDENIGLTANEIARVLGECAGNAPSENTIRGDLYALFESRPFGISLEVPSHGENTGFRCISRPITSDEAIMLHDMVRTSKFVGEQQRNSLCEKLLGLASDIRQHEALETVYVDEREGHGAESVFDAIRTATTAIKKNRKVRFYYSSHWMNGEEAEAGPYHENPVTIVFSNGQYYLETFAPLRGTGKNVVQFRRMSRMRKTMVSDHRVDDISSIEALRRNTPNDVRQRIDMFGDGVSRTLFLKVEGSYAGRVYDRFGHDTRFYHIDEGEGSACGYTCVKVQLGQTFYRWLFGMGGGVSLQKPVSKRWADGFFGHPIDNPAYLRMIGDYEEAVSGYRELLREEAEKYRR